MGTRCTISAESTASYGCTQLPCPSRIADCGWQLQIRYAAIVNVCFGSLQLMQFNRCVMKLKLMVLNLQDVRADPTLPRTRDVRCPSCSHNEAVFFSASTEEASAAPQHCIASVRKMLFDKACEACFLTVACGHAAGHDAFLQLHQLQSSVARLCLARRLRG